MTLITQNQELSAFCAKMKKASFIAVDTEFLREKTYYPLLCLIQVSGNGHAAAIDPLAEGIDLKPFWDLLLDKNIKKVMHGCRQDLEIFYRELGKLPHNMIDTQIAAMVCGFGDSISYKGLVEHYTNGSIDKAHRFTDWSLRPLSEKQIDYALSDVTYLEELYPKMMKDIEKTGRMGWISEEMDILLDENIYFTEPDEAWMRVKTRIDKPKRLAVLREVAKWREQKAQDKDVPRGRLIRDDALIEIAATAPKTVEALKKVRGIRDNIADGDYGQAIIEAVKVAEAMDKKDWPKVERARSFPAHIGPTVELLKVLLKLKCEEHNVAPKLIMSGNDIYHLAHDKDPQTPAVKGWRYEVFGKDALDLRAGKLAFTLGKDGSIRTVHL